MPAFSFEWIYHRCYPSISCLRTREPVEPGHTGRVATQFCSGGCHPSELSVLGQDPGARTERSCCEVTPATSACSQGPRLWIQGFATLFSRPAFVCFFLQLLYSAAFLDDLPSLCGGLGLWTPLLRQAVKG